MNRIATIGLVVVCALVSGARSAAAADEVLESTAGPVMSEPTPQGVGSCYEVKPICLMGRPVCLCDLNLQCSWACR